MWSKKSPLGPSLPLGEQERVESQFTNFVVVPSWFSGYATTLFWGLLILVISAVILEFSGFFHASLAPGLIGVGLAAVLLLWYPLFRLATREGVHTWYVITNQRVASLDGAGQRVTGEVRLSPQLVVAPGEVHEVRRVYGAGGEVWQRGNVVLTPPSGRALVVSDIKDPVHTAKFIQAIASYSTST